MIKTSTVDLEWQQLKDNGIVYWKNHFNQESYIIFNEVTGNQL